MSLASLYQAFLAAPGPAALADDAALNYIPTLTVLNQPAAIIRHLDTQQKLLRKKHEQVLNAIEGDGAICLDVDTTIELVAGGGAYLPGLDDNFLCNHVVHLPIIHIVHFDAARKIKQIRLYWDQGSLLKQVDVIGTRARNWPIKGGKDQVRLIANSVKDSSAAPHPATKAVDNAPIAHKPTAKVNATRDPHASLSLFSAHDVDGGSESTKRPAARSSAKPPPRDLNELFASSENDTANGSADSPARNNKRDSVLAKGGAGKHFQPSRLFEVEDPGKDAMAPQKGHNPARYNHFEFDDGHDRPAPEPVKARPAPHLQSNWDPKDSAVPEKAPSKFRPQDTRNFSISEEVEEKAPRKNAVVCQGRRDAEAHFEFKDDGPPPANRKTGPPRGKGSLNASSDLYRNNVHNGSDAASSPVEVSGAVNAQTNLKDRHKDFQPHFDFAEGSNPGADGSGSAPPGAVVNTTDRRKDLDAHSTMAETSPDLGEKKKPGDDGRPKSKEEQMADAHWEATEGKLNKNGTYGRANMGIKTQGDGMGGRKGAENAWSFGEGDEDEKGKKIFKTAGNGMGARAGAGEEGEEDQKEAAKSTLGRHKQAERSSLWGF